MNLGVLCGHIELKSTKSEKHYWLNNWLIQLLSESGRKELPQSFYTALCCTKSLPYWCLSKLIVPFSQKIWNQITANYQWCISHFQRGDCGVIIAGLLSLLTLSRSLNQKCKVRWAWILAEKTPWTLMWTVHKWKPCTPHSLWTMWHKQE